MSPKNRGLRDHQPRTSDVSVPIQASGSTTSSTSPAIGVQYEAPPHDADGKPLIVGENTNHHGAQDIEEVDIGETAAKAVRIRGGKIGGNINYGTNQKVGN